MTEVTPAQSSVPQFAGKRAMLDNEATMGGSDSLKAWKQGKIAAILEADDFNAINNLMVETGLTPSKELVGRTFEIRDFSVAESAEEFRGNSELQKWAVVNAVDVSTGEEFMIDGGGDMFISGLVAMRDRYDFPFTGTLLAKGVTKGDMLYWRFHDPKRPTVS